jgi:hypothetical protein
MKLCAEKSCRRLLSQSTAKKYCGQCTLKQNLQKQNENKIEVEAVESNSESSQDETTQNGTNRMGERERGEQAPIHNQVQQVEGEILGWHGDINQEWNGTQAMASSDSESEWSSSSQLQECQNCHRRQMISASYDGIIPPCYRLQISFKAKESVSLKKKWSTMREADFDEDDTHIALCAECAESLEINTGGGSRKVASPPLVWPAFLWLFLANESVRATLGSSAWQFVPLLFRLWWEKSLPEMFAEYETVTLHDPKSFFTERTVDREQFLCTLERNLLGELMRDCDRFLLPTVRCPWGCSCYIHKVGFVPLDCLMQRFIHLEGK